VLEPSKTTSAAAPKGAVHKDAAIKRPASCRIALDACFVIVAFNVADSKACRHEHSLPIMAKIDKVDVKDTPTSQIRKGFVW
jgi:hypothetical protein